MQYGPLVTAARESRTRVQPHNLDFEFARIFAKIYVNPNPKLKPIPLTSENYQLRDEAYVFVTIPPPYPSARELFGTYTDKISQYLTPWYNSQGHPITKINNTKMREMIGIGNLIYYRIDTSTGITEYWYLVQNLDILSGFRAVYDPKIHGHPKNVENDDVARGYIMLVPEKDFKQFTPVETGDRMYAPTTSASSASSKGGNKCSLKPKSIKRKKKQNKRNSRRRYRSHKH
jgi:hypothetical protein